MIEKKEEVKREKYKTRTSPYKISMHTTDREKSDHEERTFTSPKGTYVGIFTGETGEDTSQSISTLIKELDRIEPESKEVTQTAIQAALEKIGDNILAAKGFALAYLLPDQNKVILALSDTCEAYRRRGNTVSAIEIGSGFRVVRADVEPGDTLFLLSPKTKRCVSLEEKKAYISNDSDFPDDNTKLKVLTMKAYLKYTYDDFPASAVSTRYRPSQVESNPKTISPDKLLIIGAMLGIPVDQVTEKQTAKFYENLLRIPPEQTQVKFHEILHAVAQARQKAPLQQPDAYKMTHDIRRTLEAHIAFTELARKIIDKISREHRPNNAPNSQNVLSPSNIALVATMYPFDFYTIIQEMKTTGNETQPQQLEAIGNILGKIIFAEWNEPLLRAFAELKTEASQPRIIT